MTAWTIRIAGSIFFSVLLFLSWRIAQADILSNSTQPGNLDRAIALEPENETYRMRKASADLFAEGVVPARTEAELREVLKQNPHNSEATMDLGLLAESRGDNAEAERLLRQAAQFDLTFKPSWTLINFYFRTNQLEKTWPEIRKALDVTTKPDMLYFDVQTIYDLCWGSGADSGRILQVIPPYPQALLSYFSYLVRHNHVDAAAEVYPRAFPYANDGRIFADFSNLLFQARRVGEAVNVWNQLVAKGFLASTGLHPDRAESIANPAFLFPLGGAPFGWFPPGKGEIVATYAPGSVLFDFSGKQPEAAVILSKNLPVVPGRGYFLTWSADGSRISRPSDPKEAGLVIRFYDGDRQIPAACSLFLAPEKERGCSFHVPSGVQALNMRLLAERVPGSVRLRGSIQVGGFLLTFQDNPGS